MLLQWSGCNCWRAALLVSSRRRMNELAIVAAPNEVIERMVAAALTTATTAAGVNAGIGGASGVASSAILLLLPLYYLYQIFIRSRCRVGVSVRGAASCRGAEVLIWPRGVQTLTRTHHKSAMAERRH